ncbi:DUF1080 domain-containing protein [Planctomycetales bacterium ZRK34]|nr:DUF1080 domain-containing protein [Planctomycetales bacterium ZRK34]
MTRRGWLNGCLAAGVFSAWPSIGAAGTEAPATDAFALQGEYVGDKYAMQVIALGRSRYEAYLLPGGLPTVGWNRRTKLRYLGETRDGQTRLVDFDGNVAVLLDGASVDVVKPDGKPWLSLQKVHRTSPTAGAKPPGGAIVLFDGANVDAWRDGARIVDDGLLGENATTKQAFGDFTLHVEYLTPFEPDKRDMARGNSGIILNGRYELQINDSFGLWPTRLRNAAIFELRDPDQDVTFPPGSWQTYDIDFTKARVDGEGKTIEHARITARHNGVLVHRDYPIPRLTNAAMSSLRNKPEGDDQSLHLQGHGSPVRFRNIWIIPR